MKPKLLGILYAIIAPLFYGLLPLFWRYVPLPTEHLIGFRCLFTFITLGTILLITRQWDTLRHFSGTLITKVAKSAFYLTLHLGFFMGAISLGYQVEAAIGMFLAPAATAILAAIFLNEKLNPLKYFCVAISVCAAMIFFHEAHQFPRFAPLIALTWGGYLCQRKDALKEVDNPISYSWLEQSLIAGVLILIFLYRVSAVNSQALTAVNGNAFLVLGGGCALATIASFLQTKASQIIDCAQVGMLGVVSPVVQFISAVLIDHKPVNLLQGSAILLLLIAVVIYNCPPLNPIVSKAN
ncbi:MAG: EamA family transporter [Microcoleaceae cyanobacterium]